MFSTTIFPIKPRQGNQHHTDEGKAIFEFMKTSLIGIFVQQHIFTLLSTGARLNHFFLFRRVMQHLLTGLEISVQNRYNKQFQFIGRQQPIHLLIQNLEILTVRFSIF